MKEKLHNRLPESKYEPFRVDRNANPCVSIVVPIYMTGAYLRDCLGSIIAQTFTNWECILVNDGSSDASPAICEEFSLMDSRFKVINQTNQGVTRARANGVRAAKGEFIMFVDSDDTLHCNAINELINEMAPDVDIVIAHPRLVDEIKECHVAKDLILPCIDVRPFYVSPVAKLYRRALFSDFTFDISPDLKNGEDCIMNIRLLIQAERKCKLIGGNIYNYHWRQGSATNTFRTNLTYVELFQFELKKSFINSNRYRFYLPFIRKSVARLYVDLFRLNRFNLWMLAKSIFSCFRFCPLEACAYFVTTTKYSFFKSSSFKIEE